MKKLGVLKRIKIVCELLFGIGIHDLRAAKTWMTTMYPGVGIVKRLYLFVCWSIRQMLIVIPESMEYASWRQPVKKKSIWLEDVNPHGNHPWRMEVAAGEAPAREDTVKVKGVVHDPVGAPVQGAQVTATTT